MTQLILEAMEKSGLTNSLTQPELLEYQIQEFAAGEYICNSGDDANQLWIVLEGSVDVDIQDYPLKLPCFMPFQLMGEKAVIGRIKKRIAPLKASSHITKVLVIKAIDINLHPEASLIYRNIAAINSVRVESAHREIEILAHDRLLKSELLRKYVGTDVLNRRELRPDSFTNCSDEEVVIFFSDLKGFSSWSEGRDAAEVANFLRGVLSIQSELINENGGYLDKFVGDGVMAYWPVFANRRLEACEKAFSAAKQICEKLIEIKMGKKPTTVRIGLNVGRAFAGEFGTKERVQYTIVGTEVNLTARLEQVNMGVFAGEEIDLGSIKASQNFVNNLTEINKNLLKGPIIVNLKGMGEKTIFSGF